MSWPYRERGLGTRNAETLLDSPDDCLTLSLTLKGQSLSEQDARRALGHQVRTRRRDEGVLALD